MLSKHSLVKFCGLRLYYSSHHLEDILLTHWTWATYPIINSILKGFFCHRYCCKIFIKHSCHLPDFCLFLPYLDLCSFFFSFCHHLPLQRLINEFIILSTVILFFFYLSFLSFEFCVHFEFFIFLLLLLMSATVLSLLFFFCFFN